MNQLLSNGGGGGSSSNSSSNSSSSRGGGVATASHSLLIYLAAWNLRRISTPEGADDDDEEEELALVCTVGLSGKMVVFRSCSHPILPSSSPKYLCCYHLLHQLPSPLMAVIALASSSPPPLASPILFIPSTTIVTSIRCRII